MYDHPVESSGIHEIFVHIYVCMVRVHVITVNYIRMIKQAYMSIRFIHVELSANVIGQFGSEFGICPLF